MADDLREGIVGVILACLPKGMFGSAAEARAYADRFADIAVTHRDAAYWQERGAAAVAAVRRVRRLHVAYRGPSGFDSCAGCNRISGGLEVPWPCPTIRALDDTPETGRG